VNVISKMIIYFCPEQDTYTFSRTSHLQPLKYQLIIKSMIIREKVMKYGK